MPIQSTPNRNRYAVLIGVAVVAVLLAIFGLRSRGSGSNQAEPPGGSQPVTTAANDPTTTIPSTTTRPSDNGVAAGPQVPDGALDPLQQLMVDFVKAYMLKEPGETVDQQISRLQPFCRPDVLAEIRTQAVNTSESNAAVAIKDDRFNAELTGGDVAAESQDGRSADVSATFAYTQVHNGEETTRSQFIRTVWVFDGQQWLVAAVPVYSRGL